EQQQGLKDSINHTISIGLEDILSRLQKTTLKEMMEKLPETLKNDMRAAMAEWAEATKDSFLEVNEAAKKVFSEYEEMMHDADQMMRKAEEMEKQFGSALTDKAAEHLRSMLSVAINDACDAANLDHPMRDKLVSLTFRNFEKYWPILFRQPLLGLQGP